MCRYNNQYAEQERIACYILYLSSLVKKEAWTWGASPASKPASAIYIYTRGPRD